MNSKIIVHRLFSMKVKEFRDLINKQFESTIHFWFKFSYHYSLEQLSEGQVYDARDIQRFNEIDAYTLMFIQHGQFNTNFDQDRALRTFNGSMSWRKRHNVYGKANLSLRSKY